MSVIQLQLRRDTSANWTSANPTLLAGEFGYETNTGAIKIGDGATAWNSLAYYSTKIRTASGNPAGALGVVGDLYIDSSDGELYLKTAAATWTLQGNLTGPQGIQGNTGNPGVVQAVTAGSSKVSMGGTTANPTVDVVPTNFPNATTSTAGNMSAADKANLTNRSKAYANILDYGGDATGATSSKTALDNAIAAVAAQGGGTVFFPAGTYNLGNTPYTHSTAFVNIVGASRYATYIGTTSTTTGVFIISGNYISLEDFTVIGAPTAGDVQNSSATAGVLIDCTGAFVMLRRMTVRTGYTLVRLGGILCSIDDLEARYFKFIGVHVDHNSDHQLKMIIMDNNTSFLPTGAGIRVSQAASLLMTNLNIIHANFALDVAPAVGVTVPSIKGVNCFFDNSVVGINMTSAGFWLRSEFTNTWTSSMSTAGIRLQPTTADGVDGITFNAMDIYNNVGGTTVGIDTNTNVGRWKLVGSNIAGWTTGINLVAGATHYPTLTANSVGANAAFGVNGTGLTVGAGTYFGLLIQGNDFADNTTDITLGALTIAAVAATAKRFRIVDNSFNPRGVAVTAPAATPVLATTYVNNTGFRILLMVKHGATANTSVTINGIANTMAFGAAAVASYQLEPGATWAVAGGTAPTVWVWNAM